MKQAILTTIIIALMFNMGFSQDEKLDKKLKKMLKAKEIVWDEYNGDGVLKAKSKESGKWGMYQYYYNGKRPKTLVPRKYDSLGFYSHSSSYAIVKKKNKYGIISDPWSDDSKAKLSVRCIYQNIKYTNGARNIIAAKGNGLWGYIDTESGDTLIPFVHKNFSDLPYAKSSFHKYPMQEYPAKIAEIIKNPKSFTELDLSGMGLTFLPEAIGKCVNAKTIDLENNKLSQLPESFYNLTNLEHLYLGGNSGFVNFGKDFAKLTSLKTLYVGTIAGSGRWSYSTESIRFSDEMSKMISLEKLVLHGHFYDYGFPEFVYNLPNLKYLRLYGLLGANYGEMDLNKLKCKDSLVTLNIEVLNSFSYLNESMKSFPKLEKVYIKTYSHKEKPNWIYDLKSLKSVKITYYVPADEDGRYWGETAMSESGAYYGDIIMTKEERDVAMKEWNDFIKKLEEKESEK